MAKISEYYSNKNLDKMGRGVDFTVPTSFWCALFTNANSLTFLRANDIVSATEVTGGSYARVEIRGSTGINFTTASGGLIESDSDINFAEATGAWGDVVCFALLDAATSGNVCFFDDFDSPITITAPDILQVPSGRLDITL